MKKLGEFTTIQMGYTFRDSLAQWPKGNVPVIQMKDISDTGLVIVSTLNRIQMDDPNENHLVRSGDVVFRSRGLKMTAALVSEHNENLILSAPLFRLRVVQSTVLPAYLQWYINQPKAQAYLQTVAAGSAQMMISKQNLMEMMVEIPSLDSQKRIVDVAVLLDREVELRESINEKRLKVISAQLAQFSEEA